MSILISDELHEYKVKVDEKDKKLKELIDQANVQASKQTEAIKQLNDENKNLKAELYALKKQVNVQPKSSLMSDDDEASTSAGKAKNNTRRAGRQKKGPAIKMEKESSASENDEIFRAANSSGKKKRSRQTTTKYDYVADEEDNEVDQTPISRRSVAVS